MRVIAHRGYSSQAPENTMAAFQRALDAGITDLELDVQMTRDGQIVVIHDEKVDRTSDGEGLVKDFSFSELQKLDFGRWFSPEYAGERIPRLEDVLKLAAAHDMWVNVELKTGIIRYPKLEEKVVDLIQHFDMAHQVIISSFNHYSLKTVKDICPDMPIGLLYMAGLYEPWNYAVAMGAQALHPLHWNIVPEVTKGSKEAGIKLHPFTVDEPDIIQRMIDANVDGIISNYPERVVSLLRS